MAPCDIFLCSDWSLLWPKQKVLWFEKKDNKNLIVRLYMYLSAPVFLLYTHWPCLQGWHLLPLWTCWLIIEISDSCLTMKEPNYHISVDFFGSGFFSSKLWCLNNHWSRVIGFLALWLAEQGCVKKIKIESHENE